MSKIGDINADERKKEGKKVLNSISLVDNIIPVNPLITNGIKKSRQYGGFG